MIHKKHNHLRKGFTLIEILAVVAIIGLLMTIIGGRLSGGKEKGQRVAAQANLRAFKMAIETFRDDTGTYPKDLSELYEKPSEPKIAALWKPETGSYLEQKEIEKKDPWQHEYQYELTKGGAHPYELYSFGKKGEDAPVEDRISVWDI